MDPGSAPLVLLVDPSGLTRERFERSSGPLGNVGLAEPDTGAPYPQGSGDPVDSVLVVLDPAPPPGWSALNGIRALGREYPGATLVVMGDGTAGFDEAFEFGADVWIDRGIDDASLLVALTGRPPLQASEPARDRRGLLAGLWSGLLAGLGRRR